MAKKTSLDQNFWMHIVSTMHAYLWCESKKSENTTLLGNDIGYMQLKQLLMWKLREQKNRNSAPLVAGDSGGTEGSHCHRWRQE